MSIEDQVLAAVQQAQAILARYVEPGERDCQRTINELLDVLDRDALVAAVEEMKVRGSAGPELRQTPEGGEHPRLEQAENTIDPHLPPMPPEKRPQDPYMNGRDLRFVGYRVQTGEHAGEYPDTMPQLIEVTDADGRKAAYVPLSRNGKVVDTSDLVRKLREADVIASRAPSDPHGAS